MNCITIRFYGDLNDFLHDDQKHLTFNHFFNGQPSVIDDIHGRNELFQNALNKIHFNINKDKVYILGAVPIIH